MRRNFHWVSSVTGDLNQLSDLDRRLSNYYSSWETRTEYQDQINNQEHHQPMIEEAMVKSILKNKPETVLEVGCGSGRLYERFIKFNFKGHFTGTEMSNDVIEQNKKKFSKAGWSQGSVYNVETLGKKFDAVYAYFVLEHCLYPLKALEKLLSVVNPGGTITLVFPDFVEMGMFGSQMIGKEHGLAKEILKKGKFLSAFITLYDSRFRLPRALKNARDKLGPFPVNLNPRCLVEDCAETADTDAVYISSKEEVEEWASEKGLKVIYPEGTEGRYKDITLIQIHV